MYLVKVDFESEPAKGRQVVGRIEFKYYFIVWHTYTYFYPM